MKVALFPKFSLSDRAEGGVRRVVEAQKKYLPDYGVSFTENILEADLIAVHAGEFISRKVSPDTPRVFHNHGLYWSDYEWSPGVKNFNQGLLANAHKSDAVTVPAEWVANVFRREMWLDPTVIYNGVELPEKLGSSRKYVLWNKARVNSVCDPIWVEKLALLQPKVPFVSTFLPEEVRLKNVRTTGPLPFPEALDLVKHAGVYLSTTREVFSVGVLEAMSYGVPVLGFDYGGNSEAVEHGKSGFLVPPGDLKALRDGLDYVLSHRAELSAGARERAARFDWPSAMRQYANLYASLVRQPARPKISVVIPCFNLGRYVQQAVDSVRAQNFGAECEIIVVDDCSDDSETLRVLAELQGVTVYRTPQNLYLAHALNYGFARASGKYFMALDADNMLPENTLAKLSAVLDHFEDLDCTYGVIQLIKENGTPNEQVGPNGLPRQAWPPSHFDFEAQLRHENQAPSTSLFRRQLWERTRGYRQHAMFGDDADHWTRAAAMGFKFQRATAQPTLAYRQRADSMTTTSGPDVHYDWTRWTPKHRALMALSNDPPVLDIEISVIVDITPGDELKARDAFESLWVQTFDEWEVIAQPHPDASCDPDDYPPYVKWNTQPKSDLIVELSAGEWLEPDALERLWETWNQYPGQEIVIYSDYTMYDRGDRGPWHVTKARSVAADPDHEVGVILKQKDSQPTLAVHLPVAILNRREVPGGGRIMACSTCGGNRSRARVLNPEPSPQSASLRSRSSVATEEQDTILVQFTGHGSRTVQAGGGVSYRFGEDADHRVRRVRRSHAPLFQNRPLFQVVQDLGDVMELEGTPAEAGVEAGVETSESTEEKVQDLLTSEFDTTDDDGSFKRDEDEGDAPTTPRRGRPPLTR